MWVAASAFFGVDDFDVGILDLGYIAVVYGVVASQVVPVAVVL